MMKSNTLFIKPIAAAVLALSLGTGSVAVAATSTNPPPSPRYCITASGTNPCAFENHRHVKNHGYVKLDMATDDVPGFLANAKKTGITYSGLAVTNSSSSPTAIDPQLINAGADILSPNGFFQLDGKVTLSPEAQKALGQFNRTVVVGEDASPEIFANVLAAQPQGPVVYRLSNGEQADALNRGFANMSSDYRPSMYVIGGSGNLAITLNEVAERPNVGFTNFDMKLTDPGYNAQLAAEIAPLMTKTIGAFGFHLPNGEGQDTATLWQNGMLRGVTALSQNNPALRLPGTVFFGGRENTNWSPLVAGLGSSKFASYPTRIAINGNLDGLALPNNNFSNTIFYANTFDPSLKNAVDQKRLGAVVVFQANDATWTPGEETGDWNMLKSSNGRAFIYDPTGKNRTADLFGVTIADNPAGKTILPASATATDLSAAVMKAPVGHVITLQRSVKGDDVQALAKVNAPFITTNMPDKTTSIQMLSADTKLPIDERYMLGTPGRLPSNPNDPSPRVFGSDNLPQQ